MWAQDWTLPEPEPRIHQDGSVRHIRSAMRIHLHSGIFPAYSVILNIVRGYMWGTAITTPAGGGNN